MVLGFLLHYSITILSLFHHASRKHTFSGILTLYRRGLWAETHPPDWSHPWCCGRDSVPSASPQLDPITSPDGVVATSQRVAGRLQRNSKKKIIVIFISKTEEAPGTGVERVYRTCHKAHNHAEVKVRRHKWIYSLQKSFNSLQLG